MQQAEPPQREDRYTAPPEAIGARAGQAAMLRDCLRAFSREPSPPYLVAAVAAVLALRVAQGAWSWRDVVMVAGLLAVTPFVEWAIHVYLLHSPPIRFLGQRLKLPTAREHRAHHRAPAVLAGVLIPVYGLLVFLPMIALTNWALSFPIAVVLGGPRLAYATTGVLVSFAILLAYEWVHYLIHAPYRPRGRYYRSIWRNHRLHHYKNERYWMGVTSTVADRVIGTSPDHHAVPRSATARLLHSDQ